MSEILGVVIIASIVFVVGFFGVNRIVLGPDYYKMVFGERLFRHGVD